MYNRINEARAAAGRGSVSWDSGIVHVPVNWSDHMAGTQVLAHNPNYANQIGQVRNYSTAGENVGRGYSNDSLFNAFMNSQGHRDNIERAAFTRVAVGCIIDSTNQIWVTQNFWG